MQLGFQSLRAATTKLYAIEPYHLEKLKGLAARLSSADPMTLDEVHLAADAVMAVVRFAEALDALRKPGTPYVHVSPKS